MKIHTKLYLESFGCDVSDFIPSELSGWKAVDLHHIGCKGMGGSPSGEKDRIENLIVLTREEYERYGDKKQHMFFLYVRHFQYLKIHGVRFDQNWMLNKLAKFQVYGEEYLEEVA